MSGSAAKGGQRDSRRAGVANDVLVARRGDGSVVLHVPSGTYLKLDATATEILELLQSEGESGAAEVLASRHGLDAEVAAIDVASVLRGIREARSSAAVYGRRPKPQGVALVLRQWTRLLAPARWAVLEASGLVVGIEVALRLLPIDVIARRLGVPLSEVDAGVTGALPPEMDLSLLSDRELLKISAADWVLARWVFDATCLRRALVYGWILRKRGPELHIGLMTEDDVLAHAWLIAEGASLGALGNVGDFSRLGSDTTPLPGTFPA